MLMVDFFASVLTAMAMARCGLCFHVGGEGKGGGRGGREREVAKRNKEFGKYLK